MKKALALAIMLSPFAVNAASTIGQASLVEKDIVFSVPTSFNHTLTPKTGLNAGTIPSGTEVATGTVSSKDGSNAALYAVQLASTTAPGVTGVIKGKTNAQNTLSISLTKGSSQVKPTIQTLGTSQWLTYPSAVSIAYAVEATSTNVNADTYVVGVNASVYTN